MAGVAADGGRVADGRDAGGAGAAAEAEAVAAAGGPRAGPAGCHGDLPLPRARRRLKPRPGNGARNPASQGYCSASFSSSQSVMSRGCCYFIMRIDAFLFL